MLRNRLLFIVFSGFFVTGCSPDVTKPDEAPPVSPIRYVKDISDAKKSLFIEYPSPERFSICYGHTCRYIVDVNLSETEWRSIEKIFQNSDKSPAQEREQIQQAIGILEIIVGEKTNTSADRGGNFDGFGYQGQMDCVDESTNTTVYLTMLQNRGLMKLHQVSSRTSRGIFSLQAPHFTAVIRENESDNKFAVDSWFLENGKPPFIVPLAEWKVGWEPE